MLLFHFVAVAETKNTERKHFRQNRKWNFPERKLKYLTLSVIKMAERMRPLIRWLHSTFQLAVDRHVTLINGSGWLKNCDQRNILIIFHLCSVIFYLDFVNWVLGLTIVVSHLLIVTSLSFLPLPGLYHILLMLFHSL